MAEALLAAAAFVLATVGVGLVRLLRGPTDVDRVMAVQLLGTGGAAVLVLVAAATATPAVVDVALVVALVAAFASAAFVTSPDGGEASAPDPE